MPQASLSSLTISKKETAACTTEEHVLYFSQTCEKGSDQACRIQQAQQQTKYLSV